MCVCTDTGFVEHERGGIFAGRMPHPFVSFPARWHILCRGGPYVCVRENLLSVCVLILDLLSMNVEGSLQAGCPILSSASRRDGTSYIGGSLRVCERNLLSVCTDTGFVEHERRGTFAGRMPHPFVSFLARWHILCRGVPMCV